jgi:hypothetical protein
MPRPDLHDPTSADASKRQEEERPPPRASHGYSSEVRWTSGQGRQPYANQGVQEAEEPNCGDKFDSGDRGKHSGTTLEQMRQARGMPEVPPTRQSQP